MSKLKEALLNESEALDRKDKKEEIDKWVELDKYTRIKNPKRINGEGEKGLEIEGIIISDGKKDRIFIGSSSFKLSSIINKL